MRSETIAAAVASVLFGASLILAAPAGVGDTPDSGQALVASIRLRGTDYDRRGFYGADDNEATGSAIVAVGGTGVAFASAGTFRADGGIQDDGLCFASSGTPQIGETAEKARAELIAKYPHVWWAEFRVLPAEIGRVDVEVTWEHVFSARRGEPTKVAGDTRRIRMREGQNHVLDFVDAPPTNETYCYRSVVAEVTFAVHEDPVLAAEKLSYDLWLEHAAPDGTAIRRRFQAVGVQGQELDFRMEPMRFPWVAKLPDGTAVEAITEVVGSIRGRARPDGAIEIRLGALRWNSAVKAGAPRLGGNGIGGEKAFTVRSGETVSLPLPPPEGRCGVGSEGSMIWIDNVAFYRGRQDTLILTVTRVR